MLSHSCVTPSWTLPTHPFPPPSPSAPQGWDPNALVDGELPVEAGPQLLQLLVLALLELDPVLELLQPVLQLLHLLLGGENEWII